MSASHAHHDQVAPYGYHEPLRRGSRPEKHRQAVEHAYPAEAESEDPGSVSRRRIAVACSRCRKRKIRCTGDTGFGGGCQACQQSGPEATKLCTFMRVNSTEMPFQSAALYHPQSGLGSSGRTTVPKSSPSSSLATLHTRVNSTNAWELAQQYENNAFAGLGDSTDSERQGSTASTIVSNDGRSWSTAMPWPLPAAVSYCDQPHTYAFEGLSATSYTSATPAHQVAATSDNWASWNMNLLHGSLPRHAASGRRLPAPNPSLSSVSQAPLAEGPWVRPAGGTASIPNNGIHSHNALPWSLENHRSSALSIPRSSSVFNVPVHDRILPTPHASVADSTFGYQFPMPRIAADLASEAAPPASTGLSAHETSSATYNGLPSIPLTFQQMSYLRSHASMPAHRMSTNVPLFSFSVQSNNVRQRVDCEMVLDEQERQESEVLSSPMSPEILGQRPVSILDAGGEI